MFVSSLTAYHIEGPSCSLQRVSDIVLTVHHVYLLLVSLLMFCIQFDRTRFLWVNIILFSNHIFLSVDTRFSFDISGCGTYIGLPSPRKFYCCKSVFPIVKIMVSFLRSCYQRIVTCIPIARQRLGNHCPAEANARNSRTSIGRQRIYKQAFSTVERLCFWSVPRG
jgi:hypothetical protein